MEAVSCTFDMWLIRYCLISLAETGYCFLLQKMKKEDPRLLDSNSSTAVIGKQKTTPDERSKRKQKSSTVTKKGKNLQLKSGTKVRSEWRKSQLSKGLIAFFVTNLNIFSWLGSYIEDSDILYIWISQNSRNCLSENIYFRYTIKKSLVSLGKRFAR